MLAIKELRSIADVGLREAKELIDNAANDLLDETKAEKYPEEQVSP